MENFYVTKILALATISFLFAFVWTPFLIKKLIKYKMGKQIRDEKSAPIMSSLHQKKSGTPVMGGIVVWGTAAFIAFLFFYLAKLTNIEFFKNLDFLTRPQTLLPLGALVASAIVGMFDDIFNIKKLGPNGGGLKMKHRLIIYTLIAFVGAWWFYFKLDWTVIHIPFLGNFEIGAWYVPFFIFVIVATSFSVNETDGLDGLAGGTLLVAFSSYAVISFAMGRYELASFCAVIVGALLAFLWFNITPAKFFMGDTGAMSLGVTLGIVAMLTNYAFLLPIFGFVFVLETLSVLLQWGSKATRNGKKIFISSPIHHHFEAKGMSEATIVMHLWVVSGVSAVIGLILFFLDKGVL